ncbi:FAD-binding and (Fe-S)-binding domain-containing protein [Sulfuracidifex metallicus]|uniref:FAD-binding protein n=1 Tax=Sulfuracidifex metallicus DSM 6482 = JCM 9184 TaxID=523847 RepID=A0A6A9QQC1_SULME|nr:FAD-binding and (Fe-S)-binding domain-containing protein [Sulfuracidifex metallicus]MUN29485.1 FAD-binding protein [Sulfuracidifex metallicus DSM 6482 = JCM 9184]WOE50005.1 FAD-binding and (Fe-S)-binding domain-containing protein [Sulfuracidifex metallicus DSM 6482 = JCM 9184]
MSLREELEKLFGDNFHDDLTSRLSHSSDMGFVPELVWSGIKLKIVPDYVVYPKNVEDVIELVKLAAKYNVPITPYGRGTNRYGNAIPADGGILIDFSKMQNVSVDENERVAIADPGATWKLVDIYAQSKGLQLRTFPSSYDSTVGGGIAGDALGIGSYEFGFISDNVSFVDMINTKAELVHLEGKDLALACGAEGITGVIVRAGMKLKPFTPYEAMVISYANLDQTVKGIGEFYREVVPAWHIQVRGPGISSYIAEKFKAKLDQGKWNMVILYPSSRSTLVEPKLYRIAQSTGGNIFEGEWTGWWSFNHGVNAALRTKGMLVHQHGLIHYTKLRELLESMEKLLGKLGMITPDGGYDVDIDLEKREVLLVNAFTEVSVSPVDKKVIYDLAKNTLMMEEFIKAGGSLLSIGIFAHKYTKNRLSAMGKTFSDYGIDRFEYISKYKEQTDPEEIMNPGKVLDPQRRAKEVLEIPKKQNEALKLRFGIGLAKKLAPGGEVDGYKFVSNYLGDFADFGLKCIDCAMCVTVCPQYRLIPEWPYAPKGMFDMVKGAIAYYYLNGSIDIPDSTIAEISGCHKCGLCDGVCPAKIPISTLLIKLNAAVAKKAPDEPAVDLPLISDASLADVVDNSSESVLFVGKNIINNPNVAIVALKFLKMLGLKVRLVGTTGDSGFMDYISGNGSILMDKMKKNFDMFSNTLEVITLAPEDYKTMAVAYRDYSNFAKANSMFDVIPFDIRLLKAVNVDGNGEEVNLHVACFSSDYADEAMKRLRDKGFKVKKIEGCSGAILERNLGRRADVMARTLGERYGKIVTLCPLAAAKFRSVGIQAETLIEFLAKKVGIAVDEYVITSFKVSDEEKKQLQASVSASILSSLMGRTDIMVETLSFSSSGMDEYKKIIEPLINDAVEEMGNSIAAKIDDLINKASASGGNKVSVAAAYVRALSDLMSSIQLDQVIQPLVSTLKSKTTDEFDEKTVISSIVTLIRQNESRIKDIVARKIST